VDLAARAPTVGQRHPSDALPDVCRIGMQRTRFHLYYVVRDDSLVVVAVWSAVRGHGPTLSPP